MESARIMLAMNSDASITKLKTILVEYGYTIVDQARDGQECLRKVRTLKPDIAIIDFSLGQMSGQGVAKIAMEDKICDVILIASPAQEETVTSLKSESRFACLVKPLNRAVLVNTIELMVKSSRKIRELERQIDDLRANLDARKEVEKAKGLLMRHLNLTEAEAFKRIQRQSMDKGIAMKEIAKAIILAYDI